ncbi:Por secretion system C-terminal sorting domain-containing protein [Hymenobacter daecheongensis DSM 21074]|uniref:Por secretion system C-terminal sorting domain-containing protein n=1 Tax=Hymenobacter daecheongensis DSM 21074 TaxID=1121955 RepID=A0A1M6KKV4_9BACT|nr:T9SS type A sorting domain-containing protein [Hymenobacter daecheongensis]SHJ59555.1 Por secretion system C-terminal sorting domain-containing protein [Hymenobacter daecheongensis DSM 21074]
MGAAAWPGIQGANQAPVANAGPDQAVFLPAGSTTTLSGAGTDADGTISAYAWSQVSGPNTAAFSSVSVAAPVLTGLVAGTYVFSLIVTDNLGAASPADEVSVTVAPQAVASYTLVNADMNTDIQPLTDGAVINLATLATRNVNVRANTDPATVGSVVFSLSGTQTQNITESVFPYALFSDFLGSYFVWTPPVGSYTLTATPYSASGGTGTAGTPLTISFTVIDPTTVTSFTLIDADTDQAIQTLTTGATLNLSTLPTRNLNIRANTSPTTVGSVVFDLTGTQTRNQIETGAPYALFSDVAGNYNPWTPAVGSYSLTATPYSGAGGGGTAGTPLTVSFNVTDPTGTVTTFTLVNADLDTDIQTMTAGMRLNLATLPTRNLNIRANTAPTTVGSVVFALRGQQVVDDLENVEPYALFSDAGGNYSPWTPAVGSYSLTATPYPAADAGGTAGDALSLSFSVVDQAGPLPVTLTTFTAQAQGAAVQVRWTTASELNNREFVLQRSINGRVFTDLLTIPGHGTTTTAHQYSYLDTELPAAPHLLYYRLYQLDYSGEASFSPVRTVAVKTSAKGLDVYPTVVQDGRLHYVVAGGSSAAGQLELFTVQGRRLAQYPAPMADFGTVSTKGLPPGTYLLRFTSANGSFTKRFVVP